MKLPGFLCYRIVRNGAFTPEQDNDKTKVEPVHFYYAFHTRSDKPGVKGIIEMHRFNFCLVVVLSLSCSGVKAPLENQDQLNITASRDRANM